MVVILINILLRIERNTASILHQTYEETIRKTSSVHIQTIAVILKSSWKGLACQIQTPFLPRMNYKQLQYDFTTDDAMTTKPKIKNRILVDVLDDDLISCFVITEQEATHDSPSYSFFSKLKSKMVFY